MNNTESEQGELFGDSFNDLESKIILAYKNNKIDIDGEKFLEFLKMEEIDCQSGIEFGENYHGGQPVEWWKARDIYIKNCIHELENI